MPTAGSPPCTPCVCVSGFWSGLGCFVAVHTHALGSPCSVSSLPSHAHQRAPLPHPPRWPALLSLFRHLPLVRDGVGASPSGRAVLILSTASRFCTSLWMLWATPGYCKGTKGVGSHCSGTAECPPHPAQPPHSPGSSQPPLSHPSANPGAPARLRQQQMVPPPGRPPWPANPCPAPLRELSVGSGQNNHFTFLGG